MPDAAQMDALGFRFKIGEVCCHRGAVLPFPVGHGQIIPFATRPPVRLVITERVAQQCPGGVQLKYCLTGVDPETGHIAVLSSPLLEHELEPYPQAPAEHPEGTMLEAYETISDLRRQLREARKGPQPKQEP